MLDYPARGPAIWHRRSDDCCLSNYYQILTKLHQMQSFNPNKTLTSPEASWEEGVSRALEIRALKTRE